ncbi:hypothetical protein GLYMA_14G009500v4 [Glycine max]|uniref:DNA sliding clamp PCNA n=1 Tax=Glycine max TaxID=3847 RepID=A0A0R0G7L8_SOYBN|nr:hypothetical protein GYH30_038668 [Glycine max]KRH14154.1 hypothetical protein GLYMA_14G009500v4 [Glycine max]
MAKILRSAAKDDTITIKADYGAHFAIFIIESPSQDLISHFMMNLVDIDTKPVLIHSEAQYYHAIVKMPSAKFSRICTDLSIFGDTVSIEVTEEGVGFSTKRDIGTSIIFCRHNTSVHKADEEATAIEMTQTVSLNFGLTFLNSFTKATPLSNTVTIFLSNQLHLPVVFQYQIGEKGHLRFYLKPIKPEY